MPLRDRHGIFPPGGFQFIQFELKDASGKPWQAPDGLRFNECVEAIIKARQANPRFELPTDYKTVADTLDLYTCHRINFEPHYCFRETEAQKKTSSPEGERLSLPARAVPAAPTPSLVSPSAVVAKPVGVISASISGAHIISEWLGSGGQPVVQEQAEARAKTCLSCPFNVPGNWKTKVGKATAIAVQEHLRAKNKLALTVPNEDKLGTCNACLCHLPLKIWTPFKHISNNTSVETMARFHPDCWILAESKKKPTMIQGVSRPEVTVVITNFRRPQFLKSAFASVLGTGIKNIVITSSGATPEIEAMHRQFRQSMRPPVIISERTDSGCNANWLAGIKAAPTDWVTILHDDDLLLPEFGRLEEQISPEAGFVLWDAARHGMSYKDTCPILNLPTGIYPSRKLLRNLVNPNAMTFSPTIGCFRKHDLIEILEEAQSNFKENFHLTPTMMVGNDLLIWLRSIQKHRTFKYIKATMTSFGHHEGSTTCDDVFNRRGKLGPIYQRTREYFLQSHPKIIHVVSRYHPTDRETNRRIEAAIASWKTLYLTGMVEPVHIWQAQRDSSSIGDSRKTHFLKDVLRAGMDKARDGDLIMFTNDDSVLHPDLTWFLFDFMVDESACCAFRKPFAPGSPPDLESFILPQQFPHQDRGRDMFCFTKDWLLKYWDLIPDYVLGSTDFDSTLATLMRVTKQITVTNSTWLMPDKRCEIPNCFVYHEQHDASWASLENRNKLAGNLYNRNLTKEFALAHGVGWFVGRGSANTLAEIAPASGKLIPVIAHLEPTSGYGALSIEMAAALLELGYDVELYQGSKWNDFRDIQANVRAAIKPGINDHPWNLVLYPSVFQPDNFDTTKNKRTAWFSMWESTSLRGGGATNFVHGVTVLNRCVVAIVPCSWNASVFSACGVNVPIRICPLGIDTKVFHPVPNDVKGPLVFGSAARTGVGGIRKGLQTVVNAFRAAFPNEKDALLKIKCFEADPEIDTGRDPRIETLRAHLSKEALVDWYKSINVLVSGSASEGWGRHQHEAMSMGRPVISVDFGGVCEFFSWENGYVVDFNLHPAEGIYHGMGLYGKPDMQSMVAQMRRAYEDRKELKAKSGLAAKAAKRFTVENSAKTLVAILKEFDFL